MNPADHRNPRCNRRFVPRLPEDAAAFVAIVAPIIANTTDLVRARSAVSGRDARSNHRNPAALSLAGFARRAGSGERLRARRAAPAGAGVSMVGQYQHLSAGGRPGRGVGKALYGSLLERLSATGYWRAFAGIALPNAASVALHESVGFSAPRRVSQVGFKHGRWLDVGWWQRDLHQEETENPSLPGQGVDAA
jgi:phosphinothricin acetyltransferase